MKKVYLHDLKNRYKLRTKGVLILINGTCLRNAIISGANNIAKHKTSVDELNIFPVPDGDTGTNMSMTMSSAAAALEKK